MNRLNMVYLVYLWYSMQASMKARVEGNQVIPSLQEKSCILARNTNSYKYQNVWPLHRGKRDIYAA